MSDEQLNDKLKRHMRQVFDQYEDDTADEGWKLLRERYPEKKNDRPVIWLWRMGAVAALLLAFLGVGLWFYSNRGVKPVVAVKNNKAGQAPAMATNKPANNGNSAERISAQKPVAPAITQKSENIAGTESAATTKPYALAPATNVNKKPVNIASSASSSNTNTIAATQPVNQNSTISTANAVKAATSSNMVAISPVQTKSAPASNNNLNNTPITPFNNTTTATITQSAAVAATPPATTAAPVTPAKPNKSIESMFDNDKTQSAQNIDLKKPIDKKVLFSVYAATYVNYAKGSNKEFNAGGGVTTDIKITPNLSISTGLSVGQNSLAYSSSGGASTAQFTAPAAASYSHNLQNAAFPFNEVQAPTSTGLNVGLLNLDVPINFKYTFNPEKNNLYVIAGVSSGTFINESYNYTYNYAGSTLVPTQTETQNSQRSFESFYFGSMLNLSFGFGYPLGKTKLFFEPFLKYPINGLGDQHILFGSGGLNLKLNFGGR